MVFSYGGLIAIVRYDHASRRFVGVVDWDEQTSLRAMRLTMRLLSLAEQNKNYMFMSKHVVYFGRNYMLLAHVADQKKLPLAIDLLGKIMRRIDGLLEDAKTIARIVAETLNKK